MKTNPFYLWDMRRCTDPYNCFLGYSHKEYWLVRHVQDAARTS